jgi:CubicO group peptidase (beta-lactamase class C family)
MVFPEGVYKLAAIAVLQLEDAGKVHDSDGICRYISGCPAAWQPITVLQLLDNTSGLHDYFNSPAQGSVENTSFSGDSLLKYIEGEPMDGLAGTCCNANPVLPIEEYIVSRVTGEPFGTYLGRHILAGLHLAHTGYYLHEAPPGTHLRGEYGWQQPAPDLAGYDFSSIGGVLFTTLPDLSRLEQAIYGGRLLSAASTARLTAASYSFSQPSVQYGVSSDGTNAASGTMQSFQGHSMVADGWGLGSLGLQVSLQYIPDQQLSLIVVDNDPNATPPDAQSQLLTRLYGGDLTASTIGAIGEATLRPQPCSSETAWATPVNYVPAAITFENQTAQAVSIYWLDQESNRELYTTLAPGVSTVEQTGQDTPWLVSTATGTCLHIFVTKGALNRAVIRQ